MLDDAYAFFQNCHHLKDWLKNDPESGFTPNDVKAVVKGSRDLKLCAEIANGTKHLSLRGKRLVGDVDIIMPVGVVHHFWIVSGVPDLDAAKVGKNAVKEWETVLLQKGKLPASSAG